MPDLLEVVKFQVEDVARMYFHESRNPLRRLRCRLLGHRPSEILGHLPEGVTICRWCWKVRP